MGANEREICLLFLFPASIVPIQFVLADGANGGQVRGPAMWQDEAEADAAQEQDLKVDYPFGVRGPAQLGPEDRCAWNSRQFARLRVRDKISCLNSIVPGETAEHGCAYIFSRKSLLLADIYA